MTLRLGCGLNQGNRVFYFFVCFIFSILIPSFCFFSSTLVIEKGFSLDQYTIHFFFFCVYVSDPLIPFISFIMNFISFTLIMHYFDNYIFHSNMVSKSFEGICCVFLCSLLFFSSSSFFLLLPLLFSLPGQKTTIIFTFILVKILPLSLSRLCLTIPTIILGVIQ